MSYRDKTKTWYKSKRWQRTRERQIKKQPYCECPHHKGKRLRADDPAFGGAIVDHDTPHRGDERLFWYGKLKTMTKQCHDSFKQSQERGGAGFLKGCDERGFPLSAEHEWHGAPPCRSLICKGRPQRGSISAKS